MAVLVAVADKMDVCCVRVVPAVLITHCRVELGDEMHSGGVLASRWPRYFTVGRIALTLHLTIVNGGYTVSHRHE